MMGNTYIKRSIQLAEKWFNIFTKPRSCPKQFQFQWTYEQLFYISEVSETDSLYISFFKSAQSFCIEVEYKIKTYSK